MDGQRVAHASSVQFTTALKEQMDQKPGQVYDKQIGQEGQTRMADTTYKIGDLAREFGVTLRTLRFYEDKGLITPDRVGTTRLYSAEDRERLQIALFCKRIGLSLGEIREMLELHDRESVDQSVQRKIQKVYASQLRALERQRYEIGQAIMDLQDRLSSPAPAE
jgi:DNA-binding transcriptional MerR regulator